VLFPSRIQGTDLYLSVIMLMPWAGDLTVDTLLISKGVALLCLVPVDDQAVTERQSCSTVGSTADLNQLDFLPDRMARQTLHRSCRANERELSQCDGSLQPASSVRTVGFMFVEASGTSKSSLFVNPEALYSGQCLFGVTLLIGHGHTCFFQL